ncbi:MAG: CoA pyrophosphatase [Halospina sp.]
MKQDLLQRFSQYRPRALSLAYPRASVLVPITNARDPEIVLTRRAARNGPHSGQVAFPGGMADEEDEGPVATALRETHEEIGLPPERVELLGELSQVVSLHGILVTPYVGLVPETYPYRAEPGEVETVFQVPVRWLLDDRRSRTDEISVHDWRLYVPCYRWQEHDIWGLSAVILVECLNMAFDAAIDITEPPRER